jgi:hypothetical protein
MLADDWDRPGRNDVVSRSHKLQDCERKYSNHAKLAEHLHRLVLNFFADVPCALWIGWLD